ncbi:MAG: MCE family protein [Micromonosporaceae bacterium]
MITRSVRVQLTIFAVLTLLGTAFVGLRYVGLADGIMGKYYLVTANFASSGGVFTDASVTYRGVPVGRVGTLTPTKNGLDVELRLERGVKVPTDLRAVTANRSAIGEQHIDLRPNTESGPFLKPGDVIPKHRTGIPLPVEQLVSHLDSLARSVNPDDLAVVIDELGQAFQGNEKALARILDASDLLLSEAREHLPETISLIRDSRTVLTSQELGSEAILNWAADLAKLSRTFRDSDADIRTILRDTPKAARETITLLRGLDPNVGTLLGNLITTNGVVMRRVNNLEILLVSYPLALGGGPTTAPGDGKAHLGMALNFDDPPPCVYSNSGKAPRCTDEERERGSSVRGWQSRGPVPGPEISPAPIGSGEPPRDRSESGSAGPQSGSQGSDGSGTSYGANLGYDPATGLLIGSDGQPLQIGGTGGQYELLGPESWKELLYAGVAS